MTDSNYIILGVLFLFGFALVYFVLSKIDRHRSRKSARDSDIDEGAHVSEVDPGSHGRPFSNSRNAGSENSSGSRNGESRLPTQTQKESAGTNSSGTNKGNQSGSPAPLKKVSPREHSSASHDVQREVHREAVARGSASMVMEEILNSSAALLQRVHRMTPDEVGDLLWAMSNKLKEKVDGGWEPEPLDEAGFEMALKDLMVHGAKFVDQSSKDPITWEQRSEEYKTFLQQFALLLNVCTLGQMTVAGVSHREAVTMLLEQTKKLS